tara:strand:+ start:199 stop:741 length:543 start_codon:yes stop_codon:yes gene_type:complete
MRDLWQLWPSAVNDETINAIRSLAESAPAVPAKVFSNNELQTDIRSSTVRWLHDRWVRDFLWDYVNQANINAFGVNISNYAEMQYTEYHADEQGHYGWHHDINWNASVNSDRKVSITVQLSDEGEYEGGDFLFDECDTPQNSKAKGTILIFPSYLRHCVTPVTNGTRCSLVAWFHGPRWR